MDVWMFVEGRGIQRIVVPWLATIHVHATATRLEHLTNWLECGEITQRFAVGSMRSIRSRLSLDQYEMHDVLEIEMRNNRSIRSLAEHIESRGDYYRYALYSIDAHLAQRFFVEHNIAPFQYAQWDGIRFTPHDKDKLWPKLKQMEMEFHYESSNGFDTLNSTLIEIVLKTRAVNETRGETQCITLRHESSEHDLLQSLQHEIHRIDPDVILTKGGDSLHFSILQRMSDSASFSLNLSRKSSRLEARTNSRLSLIHI